MSGWFLFLLSREQLIITLAVYGFYAQATAQPYSFALYSVPLAAPVQLTGFTCTLIVPVASPPCPSVTR